MTLFDHPELLNLVWLLALYCLLICLGWKRLNSRLQSYGGHRVKFLMSHQPSRTLFTLKGLSVLIALLMMIIALARPRWGFEWKKLPQGGSDLMVLMDLSESMLAADVSPSRLERAKRELIDLLRMLQGDRFGLVAFAGIPFVQCPLTTDYQMAETFIGKLRPELIPAQGTDLGAAIRMGLKALEKGGSEESQSRAMILITDGEDQDGQALAEAAKAREKGVRIFVIGIGQPEGAPIPLPDGGLKQDRQGNVVITKLDEASLEKIALETQGLYVRSTSSGLDLEQIYHKGIRAHLTDQKQGELRQKVPTERFRYFVLPAILLLMGDCLFCAYRRKDDEEEEDQGV